MPFQRNFDREFADNLERKYAYDFDWVIRDYLLERVTRFLYPNEDTLEIGAYMGDMTSQILQRFPKLTVLEGSEKLCKHLSERFGEDVALLCGSIEDVTISQRFKTIFLIHTLEHLDDPVKALSKISDWLCPGGRLVVAVPNAEALSRQIAVRMGVIESNCAVTPGELDHGHRRTYNMDLLLRDVKSAGLKVVESGGVITKALSNSQFDAALESGIVSQEYIAACDELSRELPLLSASIFVVTESRT